MLKYLCAASLLVAVTTASANPVQALDARYAPETLKAETNENAEPSGHFYLRGQFGKADTQAAALAGAGTARDPLLKTAQRFFDENPAFFAASGHDLQLHKRTTDRFGNQHLRFHRLIGGVPVADMEVLVHFNPKGEITGVNGHIVRPSDALLSHMASEPQTISQLEALQQVASLRGAALGELRLLNAEKRLANEAPHLRWHLDINTKRSIGRYSYWLDAETGALIEVQNTLRHPIPMQP